MKIVKPSQDQTYNYSYGVSDFIGICNKTNYCGWKEKKHPLVVFDTPNELNTVIKFQQTAQIATGSKVYFTSDSYISPMYLSKLAAYNPGIKRVLKPENADIIVVHQIPFENYNSNYFITTDWLKKPNGNIRYELLGSLRYLSTSFNEVQTKVNTKIGIGFVTSNKEADKIRMMYKYPNKIVSDLDFIKYIYNFLPEIEDDEYNNLVSMLTNSDASIRKAGMSCLMFYNLSKRIFDLTALAYTESKLNLETKSELSKQDWFWFAIVNRNPGRYYVWNYYYQLSSIIENVLSNSLSTLTMDEIAKIITDKYLNDIKQDSTFDSVQRALNAIGYKLTLEKISNDSNGETESGNREMENM